MKPDTYFRHAGRPPCTQNATASNASKEKPRSSSVETDERFSTITIHGSPMQTHGGLTLDAGSDLYPRKHRIPNTCTANATDASGSVLPLTSSESETEDASNPPTELATEARAGHGTGTSTYLSQSTDTMPKKRGRPRKSP